MATDTKTAPELFETSVSVQPEPEAFIRYPPFPTPPPGATIIPFSLFQARGIPIVLDPAGAPEHELDGRGVRTVRLRVEHVAVDDGERAKKKRKKKKGPGGVTVAAPQAPGEQRRSWWEMWKAQEEAKGYNVLFDRDANGFQRLEQAVAHFADMRDWPHLQSEVHKVWQPLKVFIGVVDPHAGQAPKQSGDQAIIDNPPSDDEDFGATSPPAHGQEKPMLDSGIEEVSDEPTPMELKMNAFMEDPERAVKIFLSSYFREKGLVWNEMRCRDGPRVVKFLVNFLNRSKTLLTPHDANERLERAAAVADLAFIELPGAFVMGNVLPGKVSEACLNAWGTRCPTFEDYDIKLPTPPELPALNDEDEFKGQLKDADMEVIDPAQALRDAERIEALKDNLDPPVDGEDPIAKPENAWGKGGVDDDWGNSGATATDNVRGNPNGAAIANDSPWGNHDTDTANWMMPYVSFLDLLGPTAFPNTHAPGVVERSTRRIVAFFPPDDSPRVHGLRGAGAVEDVLARRFARLKMAPWGPISRNSDLNSPEIMKKSRGPVVVRDVKGKRIGVEGAVGGLLPHDQVKDTITVLVDAEAVPYVVLNMGLGATWIQIARTEEAKEDADPRQPTTTFWYMEQLSQLMPSFYTDA